MNNFYLIGVLFIILSSCSCDDNYVISIEPIDEPEPNIDSIIIWKKPLLPDTTETISLNAYYYNEKVVTSVRPPFSSEDEIIVGFDKDGKEIWRWDDYFPQNKAQRISDERRIGKYLMVSAWTDNYCFNMESGQEEWRFVSDYGAPKLSVALESLVFLPIYYSEASPRSDSTSIMMGNVENGEFKEIFKIRKTGEHEVAIPNATAYLDNNGDTIIVFQNNNLRISPYEEVIDLYSYNLSTKTINWCKKSLTDKSWNINEPVFDDSNIYFATKFRFFSIDKVSGDINWERLMPHDFQGSNYLLYEDVLITNLDNGDLIAINKHNGATVWHQERLSACCTDLRMYNGRIYMGNGDLFIIDALTGEVLFRYETSTKKERGRSNALFLHAIAVDLEHQRMYATDGYYLMCLKHPEL